MKYTVDFDEAVENFFKKADPSVRKRILNWLAKNIEGSENPCAFGKGLSNNLAGLWRYRVGDYRLICDIQYSVCVVLVVQIGHRSKIYS